MAISEKIDLSESETDSYDSEEDPIFDILEETRSNISKLSITKKNKSSISEEISEEAKEDLTDIVPEVDQQGFEIVQKSIDAGVVDKLKVDQCKLYLRKNGLRLTGNKDTLIARIKEHLDIVNGGGERKYPASSFTLNCKGDACMGDVVMFEQTVYEMFSIASRSSVGPPCGTRIVAGRIVKESYGAAKQQHTFTIEVLWSKGEKPLPPLHPLLIKGRNLYKLKTMRQRWQDEGERQKILLEKHNRGSVARLNRDTRIQEKEARKMLKADRLVRTENQNHKKGDNNTSKTSASFAANSRNCRQSNEQQNSRPTYQSPLIDVGNLRMQPEMHKINQQVHVQQKECMYPVPLVSSQGRGTSFFQNANVPRAEWFCKREVLGIINQNSHGYEHNMISNQSRGQFQQEKASTGLTRRPPGRPMNKQGQLCKYYPQGRCYFGEQCKFLHEC